MSPFDQRGQSVGIQVNHPGVMVGEARANPSPKDIAVAVAVLRTLADDIEAGRLRLLSVGEENEVQQRRPEPGDQWVMMEPTGVRTISLTYRAKG